ncbi:hypothetical protein IQ243_16315 [Nostocales cyanobacterium LEGE 11386]|nr:hypothetical protein [Nostocales cyanobacterium LEGE 11386]
MTLMDCILLTLLNTVVCIALPKLLSIITAKPKSTAPSQSAINSQESNAEIRGVMDAA